LVAQDLERLGLISTAYDALITSGDISRILLSKNPGISVFDVGPASARAICQGLDVRFTTIEDADIALSAGAFKEDFQLIDQRPVLQHLLDLQLLLLCANPDVETQLGNRRVKCSGALAELYAKMGGLVHYAGKPYAPIFERAVALASELRAVPIERGRVLVIGDSIRTDISGAAANGFDSLFVTSGIHAQELGLPELITPSALKRLFADTGVTPTAVTGRLAW